MVAQHTIDRVGGLGEAPRVGQGEQKKLLHDGFQPLHFLEQAGVHLLLRRAGGNGGEGLLQGLKLIGFGIWERKTGGSRNVTFPARQYTMNGERRSYALLRPVADATSQNKVRDLVLQAYAEYEAASAVAS